MCVCETSLVLLPFPYHDHNNNGAFMHSLFSCSPLLMSLLHKISSLLEKQRDSKGSTSTHYFLSKTHNNSNTRIFSKTLLLTSNVKQ